MGRDTGVLEEEQAEIILVDTDIYRYIIESRIGVTRVRPSSERKVGDIR